MALGASEDQAGARLALAAAAAAAMAAALPDQEDAARPAGTRIITSPSGNLVPDISYGEGGYSDRPADSRAPCVSMPS